MKIILENIIFSISMISLVSCNITETEVNKSFEVAKLNSCYAPPDKCTLPSYCNNGNGEHICLYIFSPITDSEIDYSIIYKAKVTTSGTDCNNNSFSCSYITYNGNPTTLGSVIPWCNTNCSYTRTICFVTNSGKTYIGSVNFSYPLTAGVNVYVYETTGECDFGGVELQEN
ncbi:MAG TPA: hypothetical protein DIS94_04000 [Bacteroidetes bacterium]|nr:hypothetical protein [Bacteroidota bacterium]